MTQVGAKVKPAASWRTFTTGCHALPEQKAGSTSYVPACGTGQSLDHLADASRAASKIVLADLSAALPVVAIFNGSHCSDVGAPRPDDEPPMLDDGDSDDDEGGEKDEV